MLTKKDLELIGELLDGRFDMHKQEMRDETYSIVKASEAGLIRHIDKVKEEIIDAVIDVIDRGILPQIDELQRDMVLVKRTLQLV